MQRQPAFPASCREAAPADLGGESGVIRAEGYFQ
jgi:hypothetical protein